MAQTKVAQTIFRQINGPKLGLMVGAHSFVGDENSLSFKFKGSKKSNYCKITLNGFDLYDVEFKKIRGFDVKNINSIDNLYYDQLLNVFEKETGLYTSL